MNQHSSPPKESRKPKEKRDSSTGETLALSPPKSSGRIITPEKDDKRGRNNRAGNNNNQEQVRRKERSRSESPQKGKKNRGERSESPPHGFDQQLRPKYLPVVKSSKKKKEKVKSPRVDPYERAKKRGKLELLKVGLSAVPYDRIMNTVTNLTILRLRDNNITDISSLRAFAAAPALQVLDFHSNSIAHLPPDVALLTSLTELNLNSNRLAVLPDEILQLKNLKVLRVKNNLLTALPALHTLTSLEHVGVEKNRLDLSEIHKDMRDIIYPYHKQRSCQRVVSNLYIGHYLSAKDADSLKAFGITHILTVAPLRPYFLEQFKYKIIEVEDVPHEDIISHFPEALRFIEEGRKQGGVLVHCKSGVSRSATVVIAYLMYVKAKGYAAAYQIVHKARPCINLNDGFIKQLQHWRELNKSIRKENEAKQKRGNHAAGSTPLPEVDFLVELDQLLRQERMLRFAFEFGRAIKPQDMRVKIDKLERQIKDYESKVKALETENAKLKKQVEKAVPVVQLPSSISE